MGDAGDFLAALAIAVLAGVSVVVILKIIDELLKSNKPVTQEEIWEKLREGGYV